MSHDRQPRIVGRTATTVLIALLVVGGAARQAAAAPSSAPTSAPTAPASTPAATRGASQAPREGQGPAAKTAETEEEASYPAVSLTAEIGVTAGYESNVHIQGQLVRRGTPQGSGTTELSAKAGPSLELSETIGAALEYAFDQTLYYSHSDLDTQTHSLDVSATYTGDRVQATLLYDISLAALVPLKVFYAIEHEPKATVEILLYKPLWLGLEYSMHYYDIRDADYAYLNGQLHTVDVYPELYFGKKLTVYAGYELQVAALGETADELRGPAATPITSPQSYTGHYFYVHGKWRPLQHTRLHLALDVKVGRKRYPDAVRIDGAGPAAGRSLQRQDTHVSLATSATWRFWKGLGISAHFSFEKSTSSLVTSFIASSYDAFAGTLGLSWML